MNLTTFTVKPLKGAMPITFDMNREQVEELLGPPKRVRNESDGDTTLNYGLLKVGISRADGKVYHLGFVPGTKLLFGDRDLFIEPNVIAFLCKHDPHPLEWVGFVVFLSLGMSVSGFHDNDDSQKAINVFPEGTWDKNRDEMKPYHRDK